MALFLKVCSVGFLDGRRVRFGAVFDILFFYYQQYSWPAFNLADTGISLGVGLLLRRAARHGKLLGVNEPFLYKVVDTVVHENEGQYPDLKEKQSYITKVIRTEEENFARTIDGGIRIYNEMLASHKEKGETVFSGADAFKLYDTFGFPIDLTAEMAASSARPAAALEISASSAI